MCLQLTAERNDYCLPTAEILVHFRHIFPCHREHFTSLFAARPPVLPELISHHNGLQQCLRFDHRSHLSSPIGRCMGLERGGTSNESTPGIIQRFHVLFPANRQQRRERGGKKNKKQRHNLYLQLSETKLWWISTERQSHRCFFSSSLPPPPLARTHTRTHTRITAALKVT